MAFDHLVVAAHDLRAGRAWLEARLGLPLAPGGQHERFGTHNLLLSLGTAYLELIAVNPDAPAPPHPRWFGLDTPELRARLAIRPHLIHWVARVPDLKAALAASPEDHGEALDLARGDLRWRLSVPADGRQPLGGVLPSLIEWAGPGPSTRLPDVGTRLERLDLLSPLSGRLNAALEALGLAGTAQLAAASEPALRALIRTPGGTVSLD